MIAFATIFKTLWSALRRGAADAQFRALAFLTSVTVTAGTLFYWRFEEWGFVDSLYFSVITLTTVGYGDFSPTSGGTRIFTIFYVLLGVGLLLGLLSAVASNAAEARIDRRSKEG